MLPHQIVKRRPACPEQHCCLRQVGAGGIGGKPKIDDGYGNGILSDEIGGFLARARSIHFVVRKGPPKLAQKAWIVIDNQQQSFGSRHLVMSRRKVPPALSRDKGQEDPHGSANPSFGEYFKITARHADQLSGLKGADPIGARFCRAER